MVAGSGQHRIDVPKCRSCQTPTFSAVAVVTLSAMIALASWLRFDDFACAFVQEKVLIDLYFISRVRKENPEGVARVFANVSG